MKPNARKARWDAHTRHDLIIEVWEDLDCESVGRRELERIQQALREKFGEGALESPASIARTLADEGAALRYPEVFDCDLKWRERSILGAVPPESLRFSNLAEASDSIRTLESLRSKFKEEEGEQKGLRWIKEIALKFKREVQLVARSRVVEEKRRLEAGEIAQWLTIWLQEPDMFEDWLSLRKRSPEFIEKFQS